MASRKKPTRIVDDRDEEPEQTGEETELNVTQDPEILPEDSNRNQDPVSTVTIGEPMGIDPPKPAKVKVRFFLFFAAGDVKPVLDVDLNNNEKITQELKLDSHCAVFDLLVPAGQRFTFKIKAQIYVQLSWSEEQHYKKHGPRGMSAEQVFEGAWYSDVVMEKFNGSWYNDTAVVDTCVPFHQIAWGLALLVPLHCYEDKIFQLFQRLQEFRPRDHGHFRTSLHLPLVDLINRFVELKVPLHEVFVRAAIVTSQFLSLGNTTMFQGNFPLEFLLESVPLLEANHRYIELAKTVCTGHRDQRGEISELFWVIAAQAATDPKQKREYAQKYKNTASPKMSEKVMKLLHETKWVDPLTPAHFCRCISVAKELGQTNGIAAHFLSVDLIDSYRTVLKEISLEMYFQEWAACLQEGPVVPQDRIPFLLSSERARSEPNKVQTQMEALLVHAEKCPENGRVWVMHLTQEIKEFLRRKNAEKKI